MSEIGFESLIGRRVLSADGSSAVGRIEEAVVEARDGEFVIVEFRVGVEALVDRLGLPRSGVRFGSGRAYRVRWDQIDLTDQQRPRLTVPRDQLLEWRNAV